MFLSRLRLQDLICTQLPPEICEVLTRSVRCSGLHYIKVLVIITRFGVLDSGGSVRSSNPGRSDDTFPRQRNAGSANVDEPVRIEGGGMLPGRSRLYSFCML